MNITDEEAAKQLAEMIARHSIELIKEMLEKRIAIVLTKALKDIKSYKDT